MASTTLAKTPRPNILDELAHNIRQLDALLAQEKREESRPYSGEIVDELIDLVERVEKKPPQSEGFVIPAEIPTDQERKLRNERMLLELWYLGDRVAENYFTRPVLGQCQYETLESRPGACDGGEECQSRATVFHLSAELELCPTHFRQVN